MAAPLRTNIRLDARPVAPGTTSVISGCMFSGKTSALLRQLRQVPLERCLAIKHARDYRYAPGMIVSHAGQAHPAIEACEAFEIAHAAGPRTEIVAVDDAHFFGPELATTVDELTGRGVDVVVTALDLDSWGRPFPAIQELTARAGQSVTLRSVCARCGRPADRTQRLTPVREGNLVGGPGDYEPRCRKCWHAPPEPPPALA